MTSNAYPIRAALDAAEPKPLPLAERDLKKNYAQRLSNGLAQVLADSLRTDFPSVTPTATGAGQESTVGGGGGRKRTDVKVMDPTLGLVLCLSLKTYTFQDVHGDRLGRYTRNIVRNDHELRSEATVLHQRQPYAVLIGVLFEPFTTCQDGDPGRASDQYKSSFAHHVATLSKRAGRGKRPVYGAGSEAWVDYGAEDPRHDLFERVFIGIYQPDGADRGAVRFFDVETPPPRNGPPPHTATHSYESFLEHVRAEVDRRNRFAPAWAAVEEVDGE